MADARRTTADQVRRWTWDPQGEFAQDVVLAVSELVTNGIEHGYGDVTLTVWRTGGQLRVEVADENPAPAILRRADGNAVSGRGLRIVSTVATKWGVSQDGTTTWCVFNLPQGNAR
ncbi:ATP-binding protein [Streptomyces noursei]|uniref:ATP-binding protein n=1 Tax=Streptomyces noursei TaxID=1971 RepID=UPI0035DFB186